MGGDPFYRPLSERMMRALVIMLRGKVTCTTLGSELTGRRTAYGPQTSAREGGRTLRALLRRGLVTRIFDPDDPRSWWSLTVAGEYEARIVLKVWEKESAK